MRRPRWSRLACSWIRRAVGGPRDPLLGRKDLI
uniref:Uncharacterized protein n=1 Tax=Arundo donax TaxID=35708 RepID=A0A0A9BK91_ARUDO